MKFLLLLIVAALAGAYLLPPQLEVVQGNCAALEKRVRTLIEAEVAKLPQVNSPKVQGAIAAAKAQAPTGALIEDMVRARLPFLPPEAACAAAYWMTVYQPDLRQLAPALMPQRTP